MTDVEPHRLRLVQRTTVTEQIAEIPETEVFRENVKLRDELSHALWRLEMYLAELELLRQRVEDLYQQPYIPNPSYVVEALYPDEGDVRRHAKARRENRVR